MYIYICVPSPRFSRKIDRITAYAPASVAAYKNRNKKKGRLDRAYRAKRKRDARKKGMETRISFTEDRSIQRIFPLNRVNYDFLPDFVPPYFREERWKWGGPLRGQSAPIG